jgi:hypothetical protein
MDDLARTAELAVGLGNVARVATAFSAPSSRPEARAPDIVLRRFISDFTKVGTEVGVSEPRATLLPCLGGPFLVWHSYRVTKSESGVGAEISAGGPV